MKALFCAMALGMVIFFILAVTGCESQPTRTAAMRNGGTYQNECTLCQKPAARNYYQEYCPGCSPYVVTYAYPGYGVVGCSTCAGRDGSCSSCK